MREYYIRREGDEDSSGPYDIDQISSLIEANKLDATAFYYDIETESWLTISSNQEMMDTLFPKKRKLTLRTPEVEAERKRQAEEEAEAARKAKAAEDAAAQTEAGKDDPDAVDDRPTEEANTEATQVEAEPKEKEESEEQQPQERERMEVTKMLAMAEGRAHDPSGKTPLEKQAAIAYFGMRLLTVLLIGSLLAMAFIEQDLIKSANAIEMAKSPYMLVAVFDALMTVILLLQVTEVYPLLRFRAAVGAALLSGLFYASGDYLLIAANLMLSIGIYFCSAVLKIRFLVAAGAIGLLGIFAYIYAFLLA